LEAREDPPYWAHYHIACLYASRADQASTSAHEKSRLQSDAIKELNETIDELKDARGAKVSDYRQLLRRLLKEAEPDLLPGYPVACLPLAQLAANTLSPERFQIVENR
jgi:hypothetical protein